MDFVRCSRRLRPAIISGVPCLLLGFPLSFGIFAQDVTESGDAIDAIDASDPGDTVDDARAELERFVAEVMDLTASFEESIYDVDGELEEISTGRLRLLRPRRFVLHYEEPGDDEFIAVADGARLWSYDVPFEQVTWQPLSDLDTSPLMLLSGEGSLGDGFDVIDFPSDDGRRWIEILPRDDSADFISARIAFADGALSVLELVDGLSRLTRMNFADVEINAGLDAEQFEFEAPPGVDVAGPDD